MLAVRRSSGTMSLVKKLVSRYRRNYHLAAGHGYHLPHHVGALGTTNSFSIRTGTAAFHSAPEKVPSSPVHGPKASFSSWLRWALGSLLATMLPFWDKQWKSLLRLEGEVEMAVEAAETAVDMVEKVATVTEKMASDAAKNLPEGGKLKGAALFVEHVSQEAAEEAHLAKDIIHKVDEVKHEMEMLIDPIIHKERTPADRDEGGHRK